MSTRRITFTNTEGYRLAALLDRPVDDEPIAYALFAHCFTCSKEYKAVAHISRALAAERFEGFEVRGVCDRQLGAKVRWWSATT